MSSKKKLSKPEILQPIKCASVFEPHFREDLNWWFRTDNKQVEKILDLISSITTDPFRGIGHPEPLKHLDPNMWSRRITGEHRLVYRISAEAIYFLQARYHY